VLLNVLEAAAYSTLNLTFLTNWLYCCQCIAVCNCLSSVQTLGNGWRSSWSHLCRSLSSTLTNFR